MLMSDFLLTRKSVRTFKNKALSKQDIEQIGAIIAEINEGLENASFELFTDGDKVHKNLDGKAGYGGVMIKAPAYIAMEVKEETSKAYILASYNFEKMISLLKDLGLGSCWVTAQDISKEDIKNTFGKENTSVKYLLALGYPPRELGFGQSNYSSRLGIEEFVFKNELGNKMEMEELEQRGLDDLFYYLRMAPSSYNSQPWRFVIEDENVKMYLAEVRGIDSYVDAGIVLYYYDQLVRIIGHKSSWDINPSQDKTNCYIAATTI